MNDVLAFQVSGTGNRNSVFVSFSWKNDIQNLKHADEERKLLLISQSIQLTKKHVLSDVVNEGWNNVRDVM